MFPNCIEPPLSPSEFTPEKGREQLDRMQACFDREHQIKLIMLAVTFSGFLVVLVIFIVLKLAH